MGQTREKVYAYISDHPGAKCKEVADALKIHREAVNRVCLSYQRFGMMERSEIDGCNRWRVVQ